MSKSLLGELEQKIMDVLWASKEPMKPSEVQEKMNGEYAYTTIMTVLTRLSDKGILERCKNGKAYYYTPAECKEDFAESKLKNLFRNLLSSYKELAISQFVDTIEENPEELKKLKDYLDK